jgi:hypothetical protein
MEIGFGQKDEAVGLLKKGWGGVDCFKDLNGIPRVIIAQKSL